MSRRLALVTCRKLPGLYEEDRVLTGEFAALGIEASPVVWDDPDVRWSDWPTVLIRTPWDYMAKPAAVLAWLGDMDRAGCTVWNPTDVVRWNLDKRYLLALRDLGVVLPGTELLEPGQGAALREVLARNGWGRAVVKPVIGGGAIGAFVAGAAAPAGGTDGAWTVSTESEDQEQLDALLAKGAVLVQEFVEEVAGSGEISLMFIAGEYTHAVLKRPKPGDWRVQEEYGGAVEPLAPPREALAAARRLLEHAPGPLLYARVDGVMTPRGFLLMELELFEPQLFFPQGPGSAAKLAAALEAAGNQELAERRQIGKPAR